MPTASRPSRPQWLLPAAVLLSLAASLDAAGRAGHWVVQRVWLAVTGKVIESELVVFAWVAILQKSVHVLLFGGLGYLFGADASRRGLKLLGGILLCVLAEWIQVFSRTRTPTWFDVALNLASFSAAFTAAALSGKEEPER